MRLRFVSRNEHKLSEVTALLAGHGMEVVPVRERLDELQGPDMDVIVRDKCRKAFALVGRPVIVEHTSLHIDALNGLPGGLTRIFWDALEADRLTELFGRQPGNGASAATIVGYCDGRTIHSFKGETRGTIPERPMGSREFQWDCAFVPEGGTETLAQLGSRKPEASMRRRALDGLVRHLSGRRAP